MSIKIRLLKSKTKKSKGGVESWKLQPASHKKVVEHAICTLNCKMGSMIWYMEFINILNNN